MPCPALPCPDIQRQQPPYGVCPASYTPRPFLREGHKVPVCLIKIELLLVSEVARKETTQTITKTGNESHSDECPQNI